MKKTMILLCSVAASLIFFGIGVSMAETLRVATECTYPPFNYRTADGELRGYDIDVAKGVGTLIGADIEFVCQKWDGMIPGLLADKFDLIVASLSITEERKKKIDFSVPYRVSIGRFIGRKGSGFKPFNADNSVNVAAFKNIKVGLSRASTYDNWFQAKVPDANVLRYESDDAMYLDLENGRVDVIMTNPMKSYISFLSQPSGSGFEFIGPQVLDEKFFGVGVGIGLRKGNEALLKRIDGAIKSLTENGSLEKYSHKYFPFGIHPEKWAGVQ